MAETNQFPVESIPASEPTETGISGKGLYEVFFTPTAFFNRLKSQPKILIPYIIFGIVMAIGFYLIKGLTADMQIAAIRERSPEAAQLPPRQMLEMWAFIGGTVVFLLAPLFESALAAFWGNFIMAGKARFKQVMSVILYGEILYAVGFLVQVPLMLYKNTLLVSLSLGVLVPNPSPTNVLYLILSKFNVFLIWELIVVGIGLSIIYGFSRNKGFLLSVLSVGLAAALQLATSLIGVAMR